MELKYKKEAVARLLRKLLIVPYGIEITKIA